jgi:hypothetical protein
VKTIRYECLNHFVFFGERHCYGARETMGTGPGTIRLDDGDEGLKAIRTIAEEDRWRGAAR